MAISRNRLRFRREYPVIRLGSARLHPKGTSARYALRVPRQPSPPRNDKSGGPARTVMENTATSTGQGLLGTNMFSYCRNNPVKRKDVSGYSDANTGNNQTTNANIENMMAFFGVDTPEDVPVLEDNCMVFMENIVSISIMGHVSIVAGHTIVMDNDKYCEYAFEGLSFGAGVLPVDRCTTAGYVYGVKEPSDYAGFFGGASGNMVVDGAGGAVSPNGVYAKILGTYGYLAPSAGCSVTCYTSVSDKWIYGKAPIRWHANNYRNYFKSRTDTMM